MSEVVIVRKRDAKTDPDEERDPVDPRLCRMVVRRDVKKRLRRYLDEHDIAYLRVMLPLVAVLLIVILGLQTASRGAS